MTHMLCSYALAGLAAYAPGAAALGSSVEQWGVWELELPGPAEKGSFNPFKDVTVTGMFELAEESGSLSTAVEPALLPAPLLAFDAAAAAAAGSGKLPNTGSTKAMYPDAELVGVAPGLLRPPGAQGESLDFGTDATDLHAVLIPGQNRSFASLGGASGFTVTGWLQVLSSKQGAGGNRVFNWCSGGPGVDLVWNSDGSLTLSVNEWPDTSPARSSQNMVPAGADRWTFFAARYGGGSASFYFGDSTHAAKLDKTVAYNKGKVGTADIPAAFGNFAEYGRHTSGYDRLFRGRMFAPQLFGESLTAAQVIGAQNRSGCNADCDGRACGSDGCGGSCGACFGTQVCAKINANGTTCNAPKNMTVRGFYDGAGRYKVRFSPPYSGSWRYTTRSNTAALSGKTGTLTVTPASASNHGPVESKGYELLFADGTKHFSTGTTCYQWASMPEVMQQETIDTLKADGKGKAFNKIRMTVFPKWYQYNHQNPVEVGTAYQAKPGSVAANNTAWGCVGSSCPSATGSFDFERFNVSFWQNYEGLIKQLDQIDVVADIIVFHPYDNGHWGFDCMGGTDAEHYDTTSDEFYLEYLAARLSAFKNVWWAMANEWSFCRCKSFGSADLPPQTPVWDALFKTLAANDPYGRQMSIHNGNVLYNHSQPWISHVSLQGHEDDTPALRLKYKKPVVWDEVQYEGNITSGWGALSGVEEADRFWWGAALGVSVGHSDTVLDWQMPAGSDEQPLWWAKGGTLRGLSPPRIEWFRAQHVTGDPAADRPPLPGASGVPSTLANGNSVFAQILTARDGKQMLLHFMRPGQWTVPLPTRPTVPPTQLCNQLAGTNCMGADIRNGGAVSSAEACCGLCADESGCRAWSWNEGYAPQSCWLKGNCTERTRDSNVVSGALPSGGGGGGGGGGGWAPSPDPAAAEYEIWHLDFWGMKAELVKTVSAGVAAVVVEVPDVPYNLQVFAKRGCAGVAGC